MAAFFFLQLRAHHAVWLEGTFELLGNSVSPIHGRTRVLYYFFGGGDRANLRNVEAQNREKRGMSVYHLLSITSQQ